VLAPLPWLLALAALTQNAAPSAAELRAALEALRAGAPGEAAFEAALPRLPELIRSRSDWFVAGGAYLAGKHGRSECVPALLDILRASDDARADDRHVVLDALIRLDARVEPARLALDPKLPAESLILLARDLPNNRDELAELMHACAQDEPSRWVAAGLLVEADHTRIAAFLIADTEWPIDVVVRDPGSEVGLGSGAVGSRMLISHPPWPPRFCYELSLPEPGSAFAPVRFERREYADGMRLPSPVPADRRNELRARLLDGWLKGLAPGDGPRADEDLLLDWRGSADFESRLRDHIAGLRGRIARAASELEAAGKFDRAPYIAACAWIRVELHDLREDGVGSLPRPKIAGVLYD
jgi:hypothetical protein